MPDIEYDNFLKITLFKLSSEFRRLDADERSKAKQEFAGLIADNSSDDEIRTYSTVGTRADAELMLVQDLLRSIRSINSRRLLTTRCLVAILSSRIRTCLSGARAGTSTAVALRS